MRLVFFAAFAALLVVPACKKKKPSYDRSTPVATINSFRRALEAGRIPADTNDFFLASREKVAWKLRCKDRGCNRATFKINTVVSEDEYAAKYMVDFAVYGNGNRRIMQGKSTPMTFAFHEGAWFIDQLGVVHTIKLGAKSDGDAGPTGGDGGGDPTGGDDGGDGATAVKDGDAGATTVGDGVSGGESGTKDTAK